MKPTSSQRRRLALVLTVRIATATRTTAAIAVKAMDVTLRRAGALCTATTRSMPGRSIAFVGGGERYISGVIPFFFFAHLSLSKCGKGRFTYSRSEPDLKRAGGGANQVKAGTPVRAGEAA